MKTFKLIIVRVLGLLFVASGILKLLNLDEMSASVFTRANYPNWFFVLTAILEIAGGLLTIIKSTKRFGLIIIGLVMLGAIGAHIFIKDELTHLIVPIIILLLTVFVCNLKQKMSNITATK